MQRLIIALAALCIAVPAYAADYVIAAASCPAAASLMVAVGLIQPVVDPVTKAVTTPPMPPYIQGNAGGVGYFAAIVGPISGSGCWGRLRWQSASVPRFPPGLTVYVPTSDPTTGVVTWSPTLPAGVESQIPVIQ